MQWQDNRIAFHLEDVNPILEKYVHELLGVPAGTKEIASNDRVFVPLCGKAVDMAYLAPKTKEVVGVEGIRTALEEFAKEQPHLEVVDKGTQGGFERFVGKQIVLLKGDYFALTEADTGGRFEAIFDRASMVAVDPSTRQAYVDTIGRLIAPKGRVLLVVLERRTTNEEAAKKGPPFSIPEQTLREYYEPLDWVESVTMLEEKDIFQGKPEDRERYTDVDQMMQTVYLIRAK